MNAALSSSRESFGSYTLLKKLFEDPLGETFRAGKVGAKGMEQVLLLRVFNGSAVDPELLWRQLSSRASVHEALKGANVGTGLELGRVRNIPYVAYDYISGKSLAALLAQLAQGRSNLPTDHALLIAERLSLGLSAGYETRMGDQRLLHGYLVPQLLMLANEGEAKVLGFEAAPGLRECARAGAVPSDLARYLSPEALAGEPIHRADDVYSLGSILFELLTGHRLTSGQGARAVDGARLASEGAPIPGELANLLRKSLAPQAERISDVVTWHRMLSKLMLDGHWNATTFNLAFFMHNLFREEIDRESKEIETEKTLSVPKSEILAGAQATASTSGAHRTVAAPATTPPPVFQSYGGVETAPAAGPNKAMIGGIAAAALVGLAAALYFLVLKPKDAAPTEPPATEQAAPAEGQTADPNAAGVSIDATVAAPAPDPQAEAELNAQLDKLLAERMAAMEKSVRAQYDDRIKALQQSIDQQRAAAERPSTTEPKPAPPSAAPPPTSAPPTSAPVTTEPAAAQPADASPAVETPDTSSTVEPSAGSPAASAPAPAPSTARQFRVGDLVEPGQATPPKLRSMPAAVYPPAAKRLNKTAAVSVRVRALVDENGRVQKTELGGPDPGYGFGDAALAAARGARFDPATTTGGVRVKMWTAFKVEFRP